MTYKLSLIGFCVLIFISCKTETPPSVEAEKEEVRQFFKEWVRFINSRSLEKFEELWVENPDASLIVPEKREAIISYDNIKQYYSEKIAEFDSLEYNLWDPTIWVSPTKSEAQVNFMAKRKIIFKNGFIIEFDPIRSSTLLLKFEGNWKMFNLHESTQTR